jgi:hypothetical protein
MDPVKKSIFQDIKKYKLSNKLCPKYSLKWSCWNKGFNGRSTNYEKLMCQKICLLTLKEVFHNECYTIWRVDNRQRVWEATENENDPSKLPKIPCTLYQSCFVFQTNEKNRDKSILKSLLVVSWLNMDEDLKSWVLGFCNFEINDIFQ